jgi:signal transduction histidine kinase/ActR/RegA family two-component response regulator
MLVGLSLVLGAGIIIPGFMKIREFEFNEAESYLHDKNKLLQQDVVRSINVLNDAGVTEIESYVTASKTEFIERYRRGKSDVRINTFIFDSDGNPLLVQNGAYSLDPSAALAAQVQTEDDRTSAHKFDGNTWRTVVSRDNDWGWSIVTAVSDQEIYRDSKSYLRFVLLVSTGVLLAVLAVYSTLTRQVRRRFGELIWGVKEYKLGQDPPRLDDSKPDEMGLLERHIHTMMSRISKEIETRKETESALEAARIEAENANRAKSVFLANMSHEIRNPLNSVIGFSELLSKTKMDKEQSGYLKYLMHASKNLSATINDILDLSKIEYGIVEIVPEHFNLAEEVRKTYGMYLPQGINKGLDMHCEINDQVPEKIYGDKARCSEIVSNLLSNAIKYTQQGHIRIEVNIDHETDSLHVLRINVSDTGVGITEEEQGSIFQAFSQAGSNRNSDQQIGKGAGLGLAIVRRLVNLMNGSIELESKPGVGSTFSVVIPFEKHISQQGELFDAPETANRTRSGLTALVADDDFLNQKYVEEILTQNGIEAVLANDGKQALQKILANDFDVLLLDIRMPEMTGVEVMEYVRTKLPSPASETPIIALTANAYEDDIKRYYDAGATSCMSKPYSADDLLDTIQSAISSVAA